MIDIQCVSEVDAKNGGRLIIFALPKSGVYRDRVLEEIEDLFGMSASTILKRESFSSSLGERLVLSRYQKNDIHKIGLIGLGSLENVLADTYRKFGAYAIRLAREQHAKEIVLALPSIESSLDEQLIYQAFAEGAYLASYRFMDHRGAKTAKASARNTDPETLFVIEADTAKRRKMQKAFAHAFYVCEGVCLARDLVNRSPRHMLPQDLMREAKALVKKGNGITCKVFDEKEMKRMGMGAALAVGEGSVHSPVCVHLTYRPARKKKKKIAVIGKGVTFDSGGLSLKPADGMVNMKIDMGGAASVIGLFRALSKLDLPVEVHGVFIAVENMPSGTSYRPGDVVTAMNGTTIEILNTDAEGRVTLADALNYTVAKIKPDEMIDLATLTGAVITALGDDYTGFMANDRSMAKSIVTSAKRAGELFWELPLVPQYDEALKSKVADINNLGGRPAGAIKAGLFLKHFVSDIPWSHWDIAGPVFCEKESRPDLPYGGTGVGIRTLVRYLEGVVGK